MPGLGALAGAQHAFDRATRSPLNYRLVPIVDVAGAAAFLVAGLRSPADPVSKAIAILAGLALWLPIEYSLHRWLGHGPPSSARRGHAMHHADDRAPVAAPIFVVLICIVAIWSLLTLVLPEGLPAAFVGALYVGYDYYTLVHHLLHHEEAVVTKLGGHGALARHRLHHTNHDVNFGVSSSLLDRLFGTFDAGAAMSSPVRSGRR